MPEPYVSVVHCCRVTNSFDPGYQVQCTYITVFVQTITKIHRSIHNGYYNICRAIAILIIGYPAEKVRHTKPALPPAPYLAHTQT